MPITREVKGEPYIEVLHVCPECRYEAWISGYKLMVKCPKCRADMVRREDVWNKNRDTGHPVMDYVVDQ